ncbi:DUF982 domain-containing protein [Rhizobium sp.]|uniref:DUF982 domain-containing protein n=1 Tax=Rhizobium sp. TaxID=391 RepID=UPI003917F826
MAVDILASAPFRAPVLVRIGHGSSEPVESASDAIHYLQNRWPHERGHHYQRAMLLCKHAAEGLVATEVAREAFIAAAIEAYVLA